MSRESLRLIHRVRRLLQTQFRSTGKSAADKARESAEAGSIGPAPGPAGEGAALYGELVQQQYDQAERVKESFESRAVALVSVTSALATALFGVVAFADANDKRALPVLSKVGAGVAAVAFTVAVIYALSVLRPTKHPFVKEENLKALMRANWGDSTDDARWWITHYQIRALGTFRERNRHKARQIKRVIWCEVVATIALTVALIGVVRR